MKTVEYKEVTSAKISGTRNIVISECSKGGFTVAQQLVAEESNGKTNVFMKGAFHVPDINGLYNMRDALNMAIHRLEDDHSEEDTEEEWDNDDWEGEGTPKRANF